MHAVRAGNFAANQDWRCVSWKVYKVGDVIASGSSGCMFAFCFMDLFLTYHRYRCLICNMQTCWDVQAGNSHTREVKRIGLQLLP